MSRVFAISTATALVLSLGGDSASAGNGGDGPVAPAVNSVTRKVGPGGSDAAPISTETGATPVNGPLRPSRNPNYFEDASGTPLILCGSHSWNTLQDWGTNGIHTTARLRRLRRLPQGAWTQFHFALVHRAAEIPRSAETENSPPDFTVSP